MRNSIPGKASIWRNKTTSCYFVVCGRDTSEGRRNLIGREILRGNVFDLTLHVDSLNENWECIDPGLLWSDDFTPAGPIRNSPRPGEIAFVLAQLADLPLPLNRSA